jgi:glycosyltransferase involved in cell wall biosynthesis
MTKSSTLGRLLVLNVEVSGMNQHLYRELAKYWDLRLVDVPFPRGLTAWAALRTFHPRINRWKERYHAVRGRSFKLASTFRWRTRFCEEVLAQHAGSYDAIFQISSMYAPSFEPVPVPHIIYVSYTMRLAAQEWPPWAPYRLDREAEEWFALEEALYQGATRVLTTNEHARQSIVHDYGVAPERVVTVGYGAPMETLPEPKPPSSEPVVLFVGMDFERKGGRVLLRAFEGVRRDVPEARLIIVGPPSRVVGPVSEGVEVLGHVSDRQRLQGLYRQAAVFVLPSLCEPFGLALLEAMAYGLPCIGTKVNAMPEIIADGETGLLVPPGDAPALDEALRQLLTHHETRTRMGQAGWERLQERFLWADTIQRISRHMRETIEDGRRSETSLVTK